MSRYKTSIILVLFLLGMLSIIRASYNRDHPVIIRVETDKEVYYEGEQIVITITADNPTDEEIFLIFPCLMHYSNLMLNYLINDEFNYWIDMSVPGFDIMVYVTIGPYEEVSGSLIHYPENYYLSPGIHTITGIVYGYGEDTVDIIVNPLSIEEEHPEILPTRDIVVKNYPNPFNPDTHITFQLPEDDWVSLSVFDSRGRLVRTLAEEFFTKGRHSILWNGTDERGRIVSSGVYYYRLTHKNGLTTGKMLLLK